MEHRIAYIETRVQCPCGAWDTYRSQIHEDDFGDLVWTCKRCGRENHIAVRTFTVVEDQAQQNDDTGRPTELTTYHKLREFEEQLKQVQSERDVLVDLRNDDNRELQKLRMEMNRLMGKVEGLQFALEHRS